MNAQPPKEHENFVAELTPAGRGAVAVVLVGGPDATRFVDQCFRAAGATRVEAAPLNRILFGRWGEPVGEELVVCRRSTDRVEVHCHGGALAVRHVVERLVELGCRQRSWQEWLDSDSNSSIRAAAQIALADAPTARTARILLDQYHGALAGAVREMYDAADAGNWQRVNHTIDRVLAHRDVGMHLVDPWSVVLAGAPNVGKSSLINALSGFERAIVAPTPGTTRDVVTARTAIDGWPVELADTAGIRRSNNALEAAGVELASATMARADLVLVVRDASRDEATAWEYEAGAGQRVLRVWNKIDLAAPPHVDQSVRRDWDGDVFTSAITGEGIDELIRAIGRALVPHPPQTEAPVPFTQRQVAAIETARAAIATQDRAAACAAFAALLAS